ncbi:GNAT family N-acetyltransferase [Malaciobacter molluscorum LMG 25693]|uniref:Acetyltransferase n=1 Tax=Malaciobacter molluscorum LMG 25693 TaxID=870501 RepID=A0A2G1DLM0_9BACT|nr:GNAT family N-acetyltransferase [Malaciobacter molluscorum]AXX92141.1 acetyltransferase [Malaciobacter molluscorum LMG 25693]PHO19370.1 GNAT family N-acetyltransferase [Malaciobacter molluscorum LMG 25693]
MNIRSYKKSDWNDLCKIHDIARLDELKSALLENAFLPLEIAAKKEKLFDYEVLVAELEGQVQGFIAFDNEEIAWLYVNPKMYRKGIGKALVKRVLDSNSNFFLIEVLKGNSTALNFYKNCGFKEIGIDSGVMPGNEDYFVTVHILSSEIL